MRFSLRDLFEFGEVTINVGTDAKGLPYHHWKDTRTTDQVNQFEVDYIKQRNARIQKHFN